MVDKRRGRCPRCKSLIGEAQTQILRCNFCGAEYERIENKQVW